MDIPNSSTPSSRRRATSGRSNFSASPSLSRLPSSIESPRGLLPRDSSTFSFNPRFLEDWAMPAGLFKALSPELQTAVNYFQNCGAAVSTSHGRLLVADTKRTSTIPSNAVEHPTSSDTIGSPPAPSAIHEHSTASEAMAARIWEADSYTTARPRLSNNSEQFDTCPVPLAWRRLEQFAGMNLPMARSKSDSRSDSKSGSKVGSKSDSPNSLEGHSSALAMSPFSPQQCASPAIDTEELDFRLSPGLGASFPRSMMSRQDSQVSSRRPSSTRRDSEVSSRRPSSAGLNSNPILFQKPFHPRDTMYYSELWHLKEEALARLREAYRTLKAKWMARDKDPRITTDGNAVTPYNENIEREFAEWQVAAEKHITQWTDMVKTFTYGVNFSLGWSDNPGMDLDHPEVPL